MLTIKTKIILWYSLASGIMLGLLALYIYRYYKEAELAKIDARLESYAVKLSEDIEESKEEENSPPFQAIAATFIKHYPETRVRLLGPDGTFILKDSLLTDDPPADWRSGFRDDGSFQDAPATHGRYRHFWNPAEGHDEIFCLVEIGVPLHEYHESLERLRALFFSIIPLGLLLLGIASYFIARLSFKPISAMVETARSISGQNLDRQIALPKARDEVRVLGETLNSMIKRLREAFDSQKRFVADASHEIRTPLTVITSELEFAEHNTTDAAVKESIQTSLSEVDRLTKLTEDLLLLARLDISKIKLDLRTVRLDEILVESVQLLHALAEKKGIQVRIDLDEAAELEADADKMKSVFLNLLDNAIKYSPERTVVTVSLAKSAANKSVLLTVADQGPGIPATHLPHIFKRFYREDSSRNEKPGSGLGLAIVEQLVGLHGGNVSVRSEVGKGSTFIVELPLRKSGKV